MNQRLRWSPPDVVYTPIDVTSFVRAYHVSREWLALLIRRMDAVADIHRLAASQEGAFPEHKALIRNFVEGIEVLGDERRR